ncbi:hypothetical protein A9B99_06100 [Mangrovibacter phragmitis]|uniref:N-acetylmuramidase domain-containing protein n=1 Tax=Mangrovibacter phragmitis TaxID=1691903 RepID=A0A1B7L3G9_9ENTR|nr:N-acetylmuramidase domain-containing protein [Mangrovibacter phragmitis]OAT76887.1 hypothetical protein A9B99_06100 [Mangrovibacter phragmitis]
MARINSPVGEGQRNLYGDVRTIQTLLNKNSVVTTPGHLLAEDGKIGPNTIARIRLFQEKVVRMRNPDGVIDPNGVTMRNLTLHANFHTTVNRTTRVPGITQEQFVQAAATLGCEVAAIKAVVYTESPRGAFDEKGRPSILYERHYFHKLTGGKYDSNPVLSNPNAGGYGKYSAQYGKLEEAMKLDKNAALRSASWGAFQIMGNNFREAGFSSVDDFVKAMGTLQGQLDAFVRFIANNAHRKNALINKNWASFAYNYNGPAYRKNNYDNKLAHNYQKALSE